MPQINLIALIDEGNAIGDSKTNDLVWKGAPGDMKRFKELTTGHPVIMGRKTFESLKSKRLPNRVNIVVSRNQSLQLPEGVVRMDSLEKAIDAACRMDEQVFVIGGGEIYAQAMEKANRIYLTQVDAASGGDVLFPNYNQFTEILDSVEYAGTKEFPHSYRFLTLEKRK